MDGKILYATIWVCRLAFRRFRGLRDTLERYFLYANILKLWPGRLLDDRPESRPVGIWETTKTPSSNFSWRRVWSKTTACGAYKGWNCWRLQRGLRANLKGKQDQAISKSYLHIKPIDNGQMPAQVDFSALFNPHTSSGSLFEPFTSQLPNPSAVPSSCGSSRLPSVYSFQNSPMSTHSSDAPGTHFILLVSENIQLKVASPSSSNHSEQFQSPIENSSSSSISDTIPQSCAPPQVVQPSSALSSQGQKEGHRLLISRQVSGFTSTIAEQNNKLLKTHSNRAIWLTHRDSRDQRRIHLSFRKSSVNSSEYKSVQSELHRAVFRKAESNNWEIPGNHHQLAASLSEILFRSFRDQRIYDLGSGTSDNNPVQTNR